jgi:hypothetical protein
MSLRVPHTAQWELRRCQLSRLWAYPTVGVAPIQHPGGLAQLHRRTDGACRLLVDLHREEGHAVEHSQQQRLRSGGQHTIQRGQRRPWRRTLHQCDLSLCEDDRATRRVGQAPGDPLGIGTTCRGAIEAGARKDGGSDHRAKRSHIRDATLVAARHAACR